MIKIPEKHRGEFDRCAEFAVKAGRFTVKELAEELEIGELVASIMVGYMEKTGLITKGRLDDVRKARITSEQWEAMDKRIENYEPLPEIVEEKFHAEIKEIALTLEDIIPEKALFYKSEISAQDSFITIKGKEELTLPLDDIRTLFFIEPRLFRKGAVVFSTEESLSSKKLTLRADAVIFKKKDSEKVKKLASAISERLGIPLK